MTISIMLVINDIENDKDNNDNNELSLAKVIN